MIADGSVPVLRCYQQIRPSRCHGTTGYPETVLLRLRTSAGRPNVKLGATEDGAGLVLGGESDPMYAQILARGDSTFLKLSNKNGKVHLVEP